MTYLYYIAIAFIILQLLFSFSIYRNYRFAVTRFVRKRGYRPSVVLIVPCKGIDFSFYRNIASFYSQNYDDYRLWFVVDEESDPAHAALCELRDRLESGSKVGEVKIFVAGQAETCSQKLHNLLHCCREVGEDIEVMAFADSDICVHANWLSHLVYPLRQEKNGVASGYRWFVPERNNLATLALSAVNAKIAQMLGPSMFNHVWGGSMAIKTQLFKELGLENIWSKAVSDDLSLSYTVKFSGRRVAFVPACLVASYVETSWKDLFEFGRRQFLITRVTTPITWSFGLLSSLYSVAGLWGGVAVAIYAAAVNDPHFYVFAAVPVVFIFGHLCRSALRQNMIVKMLPGDAAKLRHAIAADVLGSGLWSWLLLLFIISSSFGRTITWRGIRYRLLGRGEVVIEK